MDAHQTSNLGVLGSSPSRVVFFIKSDNKGIILIKKYVFKLYKLMKEKLKETSSKDEQDA